MYSNDNNSPLNVNVSFYSSVKQVTGSTMNLIDFLTDKYLANRVFEFRKLEEGPERDEAKKNIPCISPSCVSAYRNTSNVLSFSHLLSFDIDYKDNQSTPMSEIKSTVCNINNVCYCSYSLSGKGLWGLIPIQDPENHFKEYFDLVSDVFASLGITIDKSGSDVTRLRFASYDEDPYYNHEANVLTVYKEKKLIEVPQKTSYHSSPEEEEKLIQAYLRLICRLRLDITASYNAWYSLGCFFAHRYDESQGRELFHLVSQFHQDYNPQNVNRQFKACRRSSSRYTIGTFVHFCKEAGILRMAYLVYWGDEFEMIG